MKSGLKLALILSIGFGLLFESFVTPQPLFAAPPKLEISGTTVLIISGITLVALTATAFLTKNTRGQGKAKKIGPDINKVEYKEKTKEEMKKELEQMRQDGQEGQ